MYGFSFSHTNQFPNSGHHLGVQQFGSDTAYLQLAGDPTSEKAQSHKTPLASPGPPGLLTNQL